MGGDAPPGYICDSATGVCRKATPAEELGASAGSGGADDSSAPSHRLVSLLGDSVLRKDGTSVDVASLATKGIIGLYCSAHWCPPCRGFTPALAEWYTNFKATSPHADDFEIVFVSSDRDQAAFDEYFAEMPWLALPYAARGAKASIAKRFKVQGIPTLLLLDGATGELVSRDGRSIVADDPQGTAYPWKPKSVKELLAPELKLVDKSGGETTLGAATSGGNKFLGLYFSAHWYVYTNFVLDVPSEPPVLNLLLRLPRMLTQSRPQFSS